MRRRRVQRPGFFCLLCVACVCVWASGDGSEKPVKCLSFFSFVRSFFSFSTERERETPRALKINNSGSPLLTNAPAAHGVHTAEPCVCVCATDSTPECSSTRWFKKLVDGKIGRVQNLARLRIDIFRLSPSWPVESRRRAAATPFVSEGIESNPVSRVIWWIPVLLLLATFSARRSTSSFFSFLSFP